MSRTQAEKLKIELPAHVIKNARACGNFIAKHKAQFYKAIGSKGAQLDLIETDIPQRKDAEKAPANIKSEIKELEKNTFEQKVINYWQDGLERTAFDGYGNLESQLQDLQSFTIDKIKFVSEQFFCKNVSGLSSTQQEECVRHLVMLLEPENARTNNSNDIVIYVFPLALNFDDSKGSETRKVPYSWVKATDEIPLFNHRIIGEEAEIEGLMLSNKEAFEDKLSSVEAILANGASLEQCLNFIDQCFDALVIPPIFGVIQK